MDVATALYASAAVLLVIAGTVKLARPASTAELIDDLGVAALGPVDATQLTRVLGLVEITLGLIALVGEIAAVAVVVGGLYLVFAMVVLRAMRLGAESCGCFGRVDAPPSWWHVVGNSALAISSFVAAGGRSPLEVMDGQALGGLGFVAVVGVLAGIELVVFTALPESLDGRRATRA